MSPKLVVCACAVGAALLASGCARDVPIAELSGSGAVVGVVVTTVDGEEVRGTLESITPRGMVVVADYVEGGGVEIVGAGQSISVLVEGTPVPGEVVGVERPEVARVARVRRSFAAGAIEEATFYRSAGEASLATILSLVVGPSVGGLLAVIF